MYGPTSLKEISEHISFKTFSGVKFLTTFYLISDEFWTRISDILLKNSLSKFTPTKHKFKWNNICENASFTATSRSNEYTDEKITYSIKPLSIEPGKRKLRALELLKSFTDYFGR